MMKTDILKTPKKINDNVKISFRCWHCGAWWINPACDASILHGYQFISSLLHCLLMAGESRGKSHKRLGHSHPQDTPRWSFQLQQGSTLAAGVVREGTQWMGRSVRLSLSLFSSLILSFKQMSKYIFKKQSKFLRWNFNHQCFNET